MAVMEAPAVADAVAPPAPSAAEHSALPQRSTGGAGAVPALAAGAAEVAARVSRSVVEVRTRGGGAGAGIVWRPDGVIVTNHHVVPRDRASVRLADGREYLGEVVARDERNDLATLRLEHLVGGEVPAAAIGDARRLRPGEVVVAVGHPFGVRAAVTVGVVAGALDREGPWGRELIRADILLGPGNSGGPLVDAHGRVVGINAMVSGPLALAVPSHLAEALARGGARRRATLGIEARDVALPPALAARLGDAHADAGVLITAVERGSAADRAGLMLGDVLVSAGATTLGGTPGLLDALSSYGGGTFRLGILRGGAWREIDAAPDLATISH
jgi:serine protease Do